MVATSSDCDAVGGGSHRLDGLAGGEEMLRTLDFGSYVCWKLPLREKLWTFHLNNF